MKLLTILIPVLAIVFVSCEETIVLDADQTTPQIIIEGLVTNVPGRQYVKVSRSTSFYDTTQSPGVIDAVVSVTDELGNAFPYVHNPNLHPDSIGYYFPVTPFTGEIGRTYSLRVVIGSETYTAEDKLFSVIPIDSLSYKVDEDELEEPDDIGKYYEVLLFATENREQTDYFLFKFYRNDTLTYDGETDIYYSDDQFLAENLDGVASPIYYGLGDTARIEMYSITRKAYVFYNDLSILLNTDGGLFGPPPANSRTNLTNGAFGYFQVSALVSQEIVIE